MLGLGHGMKCKREESIIQGTEDWVWGPMTWVWARTLSPTSCVISWSNRDVNPCRVCCPGLLWEANESMCVKRAFEMTMFHKCKLLWFSLVVFGKLVSFYISHVFSLLPPIARSNVFAFLFRMRNLWSDKKKWSHQACSSPVLRPNHGRSTLPARLSSLVLVTHSGGKWDRAQQSPLSEFHYAGLQTTKGKSAKERVSVWNVRGAAVSEVYGNRRKLNTAPKGRRKIASCENESQAVSRAWRFEEVGLPTDPLAKGLWIYSVPFQSESAWGTLVYRSECSRKLDIGLRT